MLRPIFICVLIGLGIVSSILKPAQTAETLLRVTTTAEHSVNLNPMLSDDGRVVVFESSVDLANVGSGNSFHTIRTGVNEGSLRFEEIGPTRANVAALSADGQKIAFASTADLVGQNPDRNSEIYLSEGGELRQLTETTPRSEALRLTDGNFTPSLSANGRLLAFTSNRDLSGSSGPEIFLFDTILNTRTQLTNSSPGEQYANPKISGDGTRIFFTLTKALNENVSDLFVYNISDGSKRVLATDVENLKLATGRSTSHDGNRIVYSAGTNSQTQVFLLDTRTEQPRQLTQLGSRSTDVELNATLSGDGRRVAFATRRKVNSTVDGSVELYLLDLPTAAIQQITNAPSNATADVISSLNFAGTSVVFNFPRVLSGPTNDPDTANNSEIYLANLQPRPDFGEATVANAATQNIKAERIAPDSIAVIHGSQLAPGEEEAKLIEGKLPTSLKGTTVRVNGQLARLLYVSPDEVIFVVPTEVTDGPGDVRLINSEGFLYKAAARISRTSPGLFSVDNHGIILNADTLSAGPLDPTDGTLRLILFGTGVRYGDSLTVTFGGEPALVEAICPSSLPGLDEIHVRLPAQLRGAGNIPLSLKANDVDSNSVTASIAGSPLRDVLINEILTDPPDGLAGDANHDGVRDSSADEFIELVNTTSRDLDLSGYQIQTRALSSSNEIVRHRFPARTVLQAGTAFVVFGGGTTGSFNSTFGGAQVVRASTSGLSFSNSGGVVSLRNSSGETMTSVTYGAVAGLPGDVNQSITRLPDIVGPLALHQANGGTVAFSPGTKIDGSPFSPSPRVKVVTISPALAQLFKDAELRFSAKAFDEANNQLEGVIFDWASSDTSVVTIDSTGLARAVLPGNAAITAIGRGVLSPPATISVSTPTPTPTPTPAVSPSPSPTPSVTPSPVPSPTPALRIVISQVYGGGGNSGAPFRNDFIELFNAGNVDVNLSGWSVQYASATASTWSVTNLSSVVLAPGHYYLVQEASGGSSGSNLPVSDSTGTIALAATAGKVALLSSTTPLSGTCPGNTNLVDIVGYGTTASCFEGSGPAPAPSNSMGIIRAANGCTDSENNGGDFKTSAPNPRNTASPSHICTSSSSIGLFGSLDGVLLEVICFLMSS